MMCDKAAVDQTMKMVCYFQVDIDRYIECQEASLHVALRVTFTWHQRFHFINNLYYNTSKTLFISDSNHDLKVTLMQYLANNYLKKTFFVLNIDFQSCMEMNIYYRSSQLMHMWYFNTYIIRVPFIFMSILSSSDFD